MATFIYHLERNGNPFYVGKTKAPQTRASQHRTAFGKDITLTVICSCSNKDADKLERKYIREYLEKGITLENRALYEPIEKGNKYNFDFKSTEIKRAFQLFALDNGTTLQEIIANALKAQHPKLWE